MTDKVQRFKFNPQNPHKNVRHGWSAFVIPGTGEVETRGFREAHRPVSLACSTNYRFSEQPCLKEKVDGMTPTLSSGLHMNIH